jgi:RNA polymerase sigma-70 factor, ECF subfamily
MDATEIDVQVAKAQRGDREAFGVLVMELQGPVRLALAWSAPTTDLLEEVVQATFVTAFQSLSTYQLRGTFQAWLKGIATNLLARELRARRRLIALDQNVLERELFTEADAELVGRSQEEALQALRSCLENLTPRARRLIELRYQSAIPLAQLAEDARLRSGTLAVTLFRIRETLRICMTGKGIVP